MTADHRARAALRALALAGVGALARPGAHPDARLDAARILDAAAAAGPLAAPVRDRVGLLCDAIEARGPTALGRALVHHGLVASLDRHQRVRAETATRRPRPLTADPIIIVGFQRTGTTWLHHLMAADPALRALRFWELLTPSRALPRPLRRAAAHAVALGNRLVNPESRAIHPIAVDDPEECWLLFGHAVGTLCYDFHWDLPEVRAHLDRPAVAAELHAAWRLQLELLAEGAPHGRRLVLKGPDHLWNLPAVTAVFPRADIVWCHRDPLASVPSFCSLTAMHRRAVFGAVDAPAVGRHVVATFARGLRRAQAFRATHPAARIHDLAYDDLVSDPRRALADLYERLGLPLDATRAAAVHAAIDHTARSASPHRYALTDWGLDPDDVALALGDRDAVSDRDPQP